MGGARARSRWAAEATAQVGTSSRWVEQVGRPWRRRRWADGQPCRRRRWAAVAATQVGSSGRAQVGSRGGTSGQGRRRRAAAQVGLARVAGAGCRRWLGLGAAAGDGERRKEMG